MKKTIALFLMLALTACAAPAAKATNTYSPEMGNSVVMEYSEMSDGTWECNGKSYDFCLSLKGKLPNAEAETTFIVLTNDEALTFDQVTRSYTSSDSADALSNAVIVEMK